VEGSWVKTLEREPPLGINTRRSVESLFWFGFERLQGRWDKEAEQCEQMLGMIHAGVEIPFERNEGVLFPGGVCSPARRTGMNLFPKLGQSSAISERQ
jgi:hypothetical protein